jgi:hypothetical protein
MVVKDRVVTADLRVLAPVSVSGRPGCTRRMRLNCEVGRVSRTKGAAKFKPERRWVSEETIVAC